MIKSKKPTKYTIEVLNKIKEALEEYIDKTEIPIISEFCYKNGIRKQRLYEFEVLSDSTKKLIEKKEAQLERLSLQNKINTTQAIFSLKQLGWRDKQEIEHKGNLTIHAQLSALTDNELNKKIKELENASKE